MIAVYDFGEDNGRPFMVMEYLEGESLRDAMKAARVGDFRRKLKIALQLARAIECIHSKKIVHRDIKPENVHVDRAGRVTLMDFGIAKSEDISLTRSGTTLGTPFYMAPEQVMDKLAHGASRCLCVRRGAVRISDDRREAGARGPPGASVRSDFVLGLFRWNRLMRRRFRRWLST